MQYLVGTAVLTFLLLCLDAIGIVPLPGILETVVQWTFGLSLVVGAMIFGPRFLAHLFGR